jgi:tetratricopeptide (TPR) repeat protein
MIAMLMTGNERDGMLSLNGIMFRCSAFLCAIVLAFAALANAAVVDPKELYDQSTNALYNLDFNTAQSGYEALTRQYPDEPEYWNALASSIWLRITFEQQKLNLESFSGSVKFGTAESREELNPADEKRLRDTINTAIVKADAVLKKKPRDAHAMYEKGLSYSTLASFEGTVKRSYLSAASDAKTAKKIHQDVLKLDPNFDDARVSIGTYDYVVGVIPSVVKVVVGVFGISGAGKDAGIQNLETAAAKGKNASTDAKMVLSVIYSREKRYEDALRIMTDLHSKYPRNFLFEMAAASTYGKMKRWDDANRTYHHVLTNIQVKKDGYEKIRIEKVYFLLGEDDIHSEHFDLAVEDFSHVTSGKNATADEKAVAHMWTGKIFDSMKDRTRALQQYDAILMLDCSVEYKTQAQQYKRRAFGEEK